MAGAVRNPLTSSAGLLFPAALLLTLASCVGAPSDSSEDPGALEDGVRVCGGSSVLKGVDVSTYQGKVDWVKVKASGRAFAFARVSDGLHSVDAQFKTNWAGIKSAGLVRGVYQYFRPSQDPVAQADLLLSNVGTLASGDLPPVIDVETDDGVSPSKVVTAVAAWVARIKDKTGVTPIIYTASGFWDTLPNTTQFAGETLWVANYTTQCPSMPGTWKKWSFWQSSESGSATGISGSVDVDEFNGTLADLEALASGSPAAASACSSDADCNGGKEGTATVCSNAGKCIAGCHADSDCPTGDTCDTALASWACVAKSAPPACPVLTYPSGIEIQTVENAAMTASYANHLQSGQTAPKCFLDVTNLHNPATGEKYDLTVHVAKNFQLSELVGTEVSQGYGNFVLLNPDAVKSLQAFRDSVGEAVTINSGFRGPKHQEDVCDSLCGNPLGCSGTCANNSRHMWGDAFDLPESFYSSKYTNMACADGFKYTYLESGTHLHVDQNPAYSTCVMQ